MKLSRRTMSAFAGARVADIRAAVMLALTCVLFPAPAVAAGHLNAATILRRADLVRNPYLGTAVDIDLRAVSRETGRELRHSRSIMLTRPGDRTLLLLVQEERAAPGALLLADGAYRLLLPRAERPVELAFRHVVAGDLSHAGFLRVNLRLLHEARIDGEEALDGVPCWRLELTPKREPAPFGRVRYWVAQSGFLPVRIEFYSKAGELLKTARFTAYQETGMGLRPERIEIDDARRPDERTTLTLGRPSPVRTSRLDFDVDDLIALRDAGRRLASENETPPSGRQLVEALAAGASTAEPRRRREAPPRPTAGGS